MKRLTEEEMEVFYGTPSHADEGAGDDWLAALIKALPEPPLPAGFTKRITERLLRVDRRRLRRTQWVGSLIALGVMTAVLTLLANNSPWWPLPIRRAVAVIGRYRWVCIFAGAVMSLIQYLDGRLLERLLRQGREHG